MDERKMRLLEIRVSNEINYHKGAIPTCVNTAWGGYLAALAEHELITIEEFKYLKNMFPKLENDPVEYLLLGRHEEGKDEVGEE